MVLAFVRPLKRWFSLVGVVGLVACGTPPAPKDTPAGFGSFKLPTPASAPATASVASPSSDLVAARFPEPSVNYRTPALQEARAGFTTNAELQTLLRGLARDSASTVHLLSLGSSQNGVPLEALVFSRNSDASATALLRSGKPTVLLIGQQHGDEPAGSEAMLVVAQELARGKLQGLLDRIHVVMLARANPDGAQSGQHVTTNGIDIDRDQLVLSSPEAQAVSRLVRDFQPAVVVDAHEYVVGGNYQQKFGAVQRYDALLQYAATANLPPFLSKASEEWIRQPLLESLKQQGLSVEWSYSTSADLADKKLSMGSALADTARNVNGLRNSVSLVIETRGAGIGRAHFKRRVHTHVTAIGSVLQSTAHRGSDLLKLRQYVEAEVSAQACQGQVVVEAGLTPSEYTVQMLDPASGTDKALTVNWESALALRELKVRKRPCGYWLAADQGDAVARLRMLGVRVEKVAATGVLQGETYAEAPRQPGAGKVEVQVARALVDAPVGSYYVPLSQPLANLVVAALEPDTAASYFASGAIGDLRKQARVMTLPGLKTAVMP
jgi:hypothetical protein